MIDLSGRITCVYPRFLGISPEDIWLLLTTEYNVFVHINRVVDGLYMVNYSQNSI